jgi:hypothetical protein
MGIVLMVDLRSRRNDWNASAAGRTSGKKRAFVNPIVISNKFDEMNLWKRSLEYSINNKRPTSSFLACSAPTFHDFLLTAKGGKET